MGAAGGGLTRTGCRGGLAPADAGSIFGIYDPNEECSLEDMDNPEQMMKNCVLNVCQPGAPPRSLPLPSLSPPYPAPAFPADVAPWHATLQMQLSSECMVQLWGVCFVCGCRWGGGGGGVQAASETESTDRCTGHRRSWLVAAHKRSRAGSSLNLPVR